MGQVWNNFECDQLPKCDDSDTGFKLLAGYRFTPLIAAELTYFDFGKVTIGDQFFTQNFEITAFAAGVALHGDFTPNWAWVARAGLAQVKVDMSASTIFGGGGADDENTRPYFGAGISYRLSKQLSADLSFDITEAIFDLGNNNRREWEVKTLWLGATYSFGR